MAERRRDIVVIRLVVAMGCGNGFLLSAMAGFDYLHLEGVDPFIEADI
jgi:hypothetical protein